MRFLIMLEQTDAGFAVQVPDLAVSTAAPSIEAAKLAAAEAIASNLSAHAASGLPVPAPQPVDTHLRNPDFAGLLFAYIDVPGSPNRIAA